ncbi:uncharacterized protein B4U79_13775 [Dinothrombium tinctorium]|uniref:Smr domain-containing protein n=1 Tax=Dinothrombium tinctorium TaxID=1965070 RepID=A0A443R3D5_9ACAR|nr:uncharacterized protein B4U79_13775 [Dinothrombium tinctorium]
MSGNIGGSDQNGNCFVIENKHFLNKELTNDESICSNAADSLKCLQDMFKSKLDADVVEMVFAECGSNVDKTLESLFVLTKDCDPSSNEWLVKETSDKSTSNSQPSVDFASAVKTDIPHMMSVQMNSTNVSSDTGANVQDEIRKCIKKGCKVLILMRGLPGSGKSTLANQMVRYTNGQVFSTDDYFTSKNGFFHYDWSKISEAHEWNQKRALNAMKEGVTPIFIDNTNLEEWEMKPYVVAGYNNHYKIYFLEPDTVWKYKLSNLARFNKHGIRKEKIQRMAERFDRSLTVEKMIAGIVKEKQEREDQILNGESKGEYVESPASKFDLNSLLCINKLNLQSETSMNSSEKENYINQEGSKERNDEISWTSENSNVFPPSIELQNQAPKPQREKRGKGYDNKNHQKKDDNDVWNEPNENSKIEQNVQSETKGKFGFVNVGLKKNNWEFPPYPSENLKTASESLKSSRFIYCLCKTTQTEKFDWVLLDMKNSGEVIPNEHIEDIEQSDSNEIITFPANRNIRAIKIDRGTSTTDIPGDLTYEEKLEKLKCHFPQALESHLSEVLIACHEDYNWAFNLLNEFSDEHFSPPENVSPVQDNEELNSIFNEGGGDATTNFTLKLDPIFCQQLQQAFGNVASSSFCINEDDCIINVTHGVAKLIHHLWKKTLNQKDALKTQNLSKICSETKENRKSSTKNVTNSWVHEAPKSSLKEIMDLEMALNLSWDEYYSIESEDIDAHKEFLSTKLKREQLYKSYPGIDRQILDELFEANQFQLTDTIATIDQSLGVNATLTAATEIWVTAEAVTNDGKSRVKSCIPFNTQLKRNVENDSSSSDQYSLSNEELQHMRSQMYEFFKFKREYLEKAKENYQSKKYATASYYSSQAHNYQNKINAISKEVIASILRANKSQNLDLHGLHSSEVLIAVSTYLSLKMEELKLNKLHKTYVDIITGWGAHSSMAPKIKPIVLNYLQSKKYRYQLINPGVIRVTLAQ